jgi:hypothetical protein
MSRRVDRERKRKDKRKQRQAARRAQPREREELGRVDLRVRRPELARAPVYVDSAGRRIPDPFECLGLAAEPPPTSDAVQAAFRAALASTPPESDGQRARELVEARDFLLDPSRVQDRALGDLRVPDPTHFLPGYANRESPGSRATAAPLDWTSRSRLVALAALFALLEDELEGGPGAAPRTPLLFD